ncbi:hypothetical protein K504DRAFT_262404 [Pleomassaria siparia CBS 279.74]|uniref:Uncharacterized protein n=1 Tax=Pleomassaria siparia CBS 279.74 TaxID=1314801 RepID=A0A6G1KC25_9PLEO|nr:hypothetical protein K504DRAFT_262404 [Pleomassaria siparia CBS 279.74]
MGPETLPPYRHISSTPIALSSASALLTEYLSNSELHPHLHPDALITPTGIMFSSHDGPMGSVVMHNLRRVAAGLRGEYLEPEATPEPEEDEERRGKWKGKKTPILQEGQDDWQEKEVYEREAENEVGEVGERGNFVADGGEAPEVQVVDDGNEGGKKRKITEDDGDSKLDKEARRKAKKERLKELKRQKEKERTTKA